MIWVLKALVSVGLLGWLILRVDLSSLITAFGNLTPGVIIIALMLSFLALAVGALKWQLLLPEYSFVRLYGLTLIGAFYSTVLPGQLAGEAVKAYRLGAGRADAEAIAASVVVDKASGLVGLILLGLVGAAASSLSMPRTLLTSFVILLVAGLVSLFLVNAPGFRRRVAMFQEILECRHPRSANIVGRLLLFMGAWSGLLKRPILITGSFLLGIAYHLLCIAIILSIAPCFEIHVPFIDWLWIFPLISLAVLLPVSVGGLGVREGTFVGAMSVFLVSPANALALSLSIFGTQLVVAVGGGILELNGHFRARH